MSYPSVSATMVQADIDAVKTAITTINSKLPFLINLDKEQKKRMVKLGDRSAEFASDCLSASVTFPMVLPPSFDKVEFGKDTSLFKTLDELKLLIDSLHEKVNDTHTVVGSESMKASLEVYSYVKKEKNKVPGLKVMADKLSERFKDQGKRKPKPAN